MVKVLAIAMVAAMASAAPAFAQSAGAPGAIGSTGGLSGHNTPGGGVNAQRAYPDDGGGYAPYGERRSYQPGLIEGRAGAPDADGPAYNSGDHRMRNSGNINENNYMGDRNGPDNGR